MQERGAISSSPMAGATQSLAMHIRAQKGRSKVWACTAVSVKDGYIEETWVQEGQPDESLPSMKAIKKRLMKAMKKKHSMKAMKKKPSMKAIKIKPSMKAMKIKAMMMKKAFKT